MKVRGERECRSCGTQWSYYDTGAITCPECGSVHSVGLDERTEHTDAPVSLDLTSVRNRVDEDSLAEVATAAAERCREYTRKRGFIDGGSLRPLDETYVAAVELRHVAGEIEREMRPGDAAKRYFFELLAGADTGERPAVETVPKGLRKPFGLAMAAAVDAYQRDVRRYLDDNPDPEARRLSGRIRDHRKRIEALGGDVDPADAHRLLRAAGDLGTFIDGEESAAITTDNWLSGLEK